VKAVPTGDRHDVVTSRSRVALRRRLINQARADQHVHLLFLLAPISEHLPDPSVIGLRVGFRPANAAIDAQRNHGYQVSDDAIAHLGPAHFEAINPYGTLTFDVVGVLKRSRRSLRQPGAGRS
jgi:hypothetical protein